MQKSQYHTPLIVVAICIRLFTDATRAQKGVNPQWLNFDVRRLKPHECNAAYHFHRYAEELFVIQQGEASLRTPEGVEIVK